MAISYKKLWKLLIDRDMKKKDLMVDYSQESRHKKVKTLRKKGLHLWWN